jgi:hypothetical protein
MSTRDPYKMGKTYRSTDEAFKDADYATPIWRCETESERGWRIVRGLGAVILGVGFSVWLTIALVDWLKGFPNG